MHFLLLWRSQSWGAARIVIMDKVLVTGGLGVVGSALVRRLQQLASHVSVLDLAAKPGTADCGDIRDPETVSNAFKHVCGVLHLAAVSRVGWGEEDPAKCLSVNVAGTEAVLTAALSSARRPWVLFVSSREVYGNPIRLPVVEDDAIAPVNTYGRSKAEGEKLVSTARQNGLTAACLRLPSVYGSTSDIPDRVIPAFARGAMSGKALRITGADQLCDFLHVSDAVEGLVAMATRLDRDGRSPPTVHLASGRGTSLGELARLVTQLAGSRSPIIEEAARAFDVRGFVGNPARARAELDWRPTVELESGLLQLIKDFKNERFGGGALKVS